MATYKIIRMFAPSLNKPNKIVDKGLTLKEAQAHCRKESTHKVRTDGSVEWFDGYIEEVAE